MRTINCLEWGVGEFSSILWLQIAAISYYFKPNLRCRKEVRHEINKLLGVGVGESSCNPLFTDSNLL